MDVPFPKTGGLLTMIITTSVTPTAPSTELLSAVLESFSRHCPGVLKCRMVVVFDGYDHIVNKARLKKGHVTPEQAEAYDIYKRNIKKLILEQHYTGTEEVVFTHDNLQAEYGKPWVDENIVDYTTLQTKDQVVTFIEPSRRLGFGLAVRSALRIVQTPYVWVQQHDWVLVSDIPVDPLLQIMRDSESDSRAPIRYVCLPVVAMLSYAASSDVASYPALKSLTSLLKADFTPSSHPNPKIPLTPFFHWHDKPHIASTSHYLARVFPTRLALLRGDFIEDKIGKKAREQMKEGQWHKWATWLYYPHEGKQWCLKHLQGRTWRGTEQEALRAAMWRKWQKDKTLKPNLDIFPGKEHPDDFRSLSSESSSIGCVLNGV